jgi:hypothetical protein
MRSEHPASFKMEPCFRAALPQVPARFRWAAKRSLPLKVQGGYFRKFSGSDWLWGFKFAYSDLAASSTLGNVLLPQAGSNTTVAGVTTPFTGTAVARTYQTTIDHQIAFTPLIGHSFEKSFVYLGAGPTLSHIRTNVSGLVGFANVIGIPTDISGAPVDFTGSGWVYGGAAMVGASYFLSPSWFWTSVTATP